MKLNGEHPAVPWLNVSKPKIQNYAFVNLRHLETQRNSLRGELPLAELDLDVRDEMIRARSRLRYDLKLKKWTTRFW
jgi:hypothetical protein